MFGSLFRSCPYVCIEWQLIHRERSVARVPLALRKYMVLGRVFKNNDRNDLVFISFNEYTR